MKKLLTGILVFCVMCFCANVSMACECCCDKAKASSECECVKGECECGCQKATCKKVKKCVKKCMKKCKKQGCCPKSAIECPVKCNKELGSENNKTVSEIITDSIEPATNQGTIINEEKCDKSPCCKKCPCMQKCLKKCKKDLSKCPKEGCPLKDIIEE